MQLPVFASLLILGQELLTLVDSWNGAVGEDGVPAAAIRVWTAARRDSYRMVLQPVSLLNSIGTLLALDRIDDSAPTKKFTGHVGPP
jgi:hypothetical protein